MTDKIPATRHFIWQIISHQSTHYMAKIRIVCQIMGGRKFAHVYEALRMYW